MYHTKSYFPSHPNPQFARKDFLNLDGQWDFVFDDQDEGINNQYLQRFPTGLKINVPFSYQTENSGINIKEPHKILWYQKGFEFSKISNQRVFLHFEGVDYLADVYLNGQYLGHHQGGYERFSFEVTSLLKKGMNVLIVRAEDDFSAIHPRGKQRTKPESFGCFYTETSGIWKSVWLEKTGQTLLYSVKIYPSFKDNEVKMEYEVQGKEDGIELETEITYHDELIARERKTVNHPFFTQTFDLTTDSDFLKIQIWSPEHPNLYDVKFTILKNGKIIDTVYSYFGVAEYSAQDRNIYLNRCHFFPRFVLDQGYSSKGGLTLKEEEMVKDISLMKNIGMNGCRKHQKIESDLFYYYADILGYALWQELPSFYDWKQETILLASHEWLEILKQHLNHPCLMAYVICNESWGIQSINEKKEQQEFTLGLYHLTKAIDPKRFVISNDGWEHTLSDFLTLHDYSSSKEELLKEFSSMEEDLKNGIERTDSILKPRAIDNSKVMDKPILLTEFGGIAFQKDQKDGWGYGNMVTSDEEYLKRIKGQVDAIFESGEIQGFCYTQVSDVEQEKNGLTDESRNYKADKEKLKEIFGRER
ncbi:MAG: glycoside hydrolase family 2 [Bacilli bacterium]|jgi:beta-galactosidase/beta-glucuronidase|nr:glycoside hydrolase family 2 [Bacilli bacterium]